MSFCARDWPTRFRFYEAIFMLFNSRVLGFSKKNLLHVGEIQARPFMLASNLFVSSFEQGALFLPTVSLNKLRIDRSSHG